jgi:hypothetical protein
MFGPALHLDRLRIATIPLWNRAFVASGSLMVWPARHACPDLGAPEVPLPMQAVFVHELTHVWQAQRGVFLPFAKIRAGDTPASYAYDLKQGSPFGALNIEQQAMVVEHAFLASRGATVQHRPETYAELGQPWRQA